MWNIFRAILKIGEDVCPPILRLLKNKICRILTQFKILNPVERKPIPSGDKEEFNFRIDKTIGKDTSVMITYTDSNAPHVTLVLPDRFDAESRGMYVRYDQYKVCFNKNYFLLYSAVN